ncbi:MAG: methenyltetrahydromethanopterin cyclohydrolase [Anaerolineaceae bacterium]
MNSMNENAWKILLYRQSLFEQVGMLSEIKPCGTWVIDAGVACSGGFLAGQIMAEVGIAGLGSVRVEQGSLLDMPWPWVTIDSDQPLLSCFLCQSANWPVKKDTFFAMGSGPACLLNADLHIGQAFEYVEKSDHAVLVMETRTIPDDEVCTYIAKECGVQPENLAILVAPTSCVSGSVQIAARSLETGLHKLHQLGFDLSLVRSSMGRCPISAPTGDDFTALGRTNDMVFFASQVWMAVAKTSDAQLAELATKIPSCSSPAYGKPFIEILKQAGDFYAIDPGLFAPAEVTLTNIETGHVFHGGGMDGDRLQQVLYA